VGHTSRATFFISSSLLRKYPLCTYIAPSMQGSSDTKMRDNLLFTPVHACINPLLSCNQSRALVVAWLNGDQAAKGNCPDCRAEPAGRA
jgi:hypothetical protein